MSTSGIKNIIEAIIFASSDEVTAKEIKDILDTFKIESNVKEIEQDIDSLNAEYENSESAFEIIKISGGYQFATKKKFAHFVGKLYAESQRNKLNWQECNFSFAYPF